MHGQQNINIYSRSILILYLLCQGVPKCLFLPSLPTTTPMHSPIHATAPPMSSYLICRPTLCILYGPEFLQWGRVCCLYNPQ